MPEPVTLDGLTYRAYAPEDFDGLLALWDLAGWGPIDPTWFRRRWLEGPAGPSFVQMIEDADGQLVGTQLEDFKPVYMFGEIGLMGNGHATILAPQLRRSGSGRRAVDESHPAIRMDRWLEEELLARKLAGTYSIPNPLFHSWPDFCDRPSVSHDFGCLKLIVDDIPTGSPPLDVRPMSTFHSEYDRLWQRAIVGLGIESAIVRDSVWLNHMRQSNLNLECRLPRTGEVVGYASLWNDQGGRLDDVFAVDHDAMDAVVRSVAYWLRDHRDQHRLRHASVLAHPWTAGTLSALGAERVDDQWLFRLQVRTGNRDQALTPGHDPAHWYVTTGD